MKRNLANPVIARNASERNLPRPCHCEERQRRGNLVFKSRIAASVGIALFLAMT
jgi:hypothetical protein